jgi:probable FeS assembly SUF system protein SufT
MAGNLIELSRDCEATQIPFGTPQQLKAGTRVRLMQSLGGSYTVASEQGHMLRIDSADADALGMAPPNAEVAQAEFSEKLVWDQLKTVYDPEIPVNVVDLGLIYSCKIAPEADGHTIEIDMSMTAPGCGMGDVLKADIERKLSKLPGVKQVRATIVFDPPWTPARMSDAAKLQLGLDLESDPSLPML